MKLLKDDGDVCGVTECVTDHRSHGGPSWLARHEDQRSSPSTQIPRVLMLWNGDPPRAVVPVTILRRGL